MATVGYPKLTPESPHDMVTGMTSFFAGEKEAAWKSFERLAAVGDPDAEIMLGTILIHGPGVMRTSPHYRKLNPNPGPWDTQDIDAGLGWYQKAAARGCIFALLMLGDTYIKHPYVSRNYKEAFKWYMKAAELGDAAGQRTVGVMLRKGQGTQKDGQAAAVWLHRAVMQGDTDAMHNLGGMYAKGEGVPYCPMEAGVLLHLAVRGGCRAAQGKYVELLMDIKDKPATFEGRTPSRTVLLQDSF